MADNCGRWAKELPTTSSSSFSKKREARRYLRRNLSASNSINSNNYYRDNGDDDVVDVCGRNYNGKLTAASLHFSPTIKYGISAASLEFVVTVVLHVLVVAWLNIYLFSLLPVGAANVPSRLPTPVQVGQIETSYSTPAKENSNNFQFVQWLLKHKADRLSQTCPKFATLSTKIAVASKCSKQGCGNEGIEQEWPQQLKLMNKVHPPTSTLTFKGHNPHVESATGASENVGSAAQLDQGTDKPERLDIEHSSNILSNKADVMHPGHPELTPQVEDPMQDDGEGKGLTHDAPVVVSQVLSTKTAGLKSLSHSITEPEEPSNESNLNAISSNNEGMEVSSTEKMVSSRKSNDTMLTTTETHDGIMSTHGTSNTPVSLKSQTGPQGSVSTTIAHDIPTNPVETLDKASTETLDGTSTTTETPDGASATNETPDGASATTESPDGASTTTETLDGTSPTTETPDGASTTTETPDGASTTTETPDGASPTTETPDGASTTTETPDGASTTTETPDGASTTTETPGEASPTTESADGTSPTTETPDGASPTTESADGASPTTESPDGASTTTESPDGASTTTETPDGASPTTESPDGASTTTETPDGASTTTTETPDGASTTTESPDGASTTTETPDGASTTTETPDGASTTTETLDGASTTTETPDGASTTTETPDGASTTTETQDGASTTTETPDGASTTTETPDGASTTTETPDGASTTTETPDGASTTTETPDGASTTTETPDGAVFPPVPTMDGVDLSVHDMPDFANWKKEFYGNDTKHGVVLKDRVVEVSEGKVDISSSPVRLNNYASHECGAKVISSNKEADNLQAVLNENKDQYIIQPCSAKKWLVIELCESVLIRHIQIGNLELFSSIFENFTVSISQTKNGGGKDRPGKDWLPVGSFQGKEERAMQTFVVNQLELYTTFVKVEVLSHYGNEHYCPITIIRVHGTSFNDDDDDDDTINSGLDLEKEPELPCTEPPPSEDISRDVGASLKFVFPPQPVECFLCYSSLKDVPEYCWPPYYHLLDNSTQAPSRSDSSDVDRPCDPSSAPGEPAKLPSSNNGAEAENNSTRETNDFDIDAVIVSSHAEATVPSKVQTTPVAAEVAVNDGSTQEAATATVTTSLGIVEETTPTPVESIEPTAMAGADEILPSPPTLAQPPTAAPTDEGPTEQPPKNEQDKDLADPPVEQSEPPPPPAMRSVKKNSAIGSVKNQVKSLERSLQVTNRYLEEMSKKSKNQKEDLQRALNQTMKLLHNTTLRLETMIKSYEALKVTTQQLSKQVASLEEHVNRNNTDWLTPVVSICALLLTIVLSQCLSSYRQQAVNRQQVEQILGTLPESPVRRLKRRGSTSAAWMVDFNELANSVPQEDNLLKRANSCISFESSEMNQMMQPRDKQSGSRVGDNSADPAVPIEIISPTTWRTFNTPDGKAGKRRKKTLRGKQQLLGASDSAPIPEESHLPRVSLEGVTRQSDGRTARLTTS